MDFRKMRRFKQQLSDEECVRILTQEKRGVLALIGDGGYPYAVPMDFVYDNGAVYFHSAKEGHKIDALSSCEKLSFCVVTKGEKPDEDWAYYVRSVIVFGRGRMISDDEEKISALRLLGNKYYPSSQEVEEEILKDGDRAAVIALSIEHMTGKKVHEK